MAELVVDGRELVLRLSAAEKVEGLHGDLKVPLTSVNAVEILEDAHRAAGIRAGVKVGMRIPGVAEVGSIYGKKKRFAAVHHDTPRGLRIVLDDENFDEWLVGCQDPEGLKSEIDQARNN